MDLIPATLRTQLVAELQYAETCAKFNGVSNTRNFEPEQQHKPMRGGQQKTSRRKHYAILGLPPVPSTSCAFGVPPVKRPKFAFPRTRSKNSGNQKKKCSFASHACNLYFVLCLEQGTSTPSCPEERLVSMETNSHTSICPEDQYDFFNTIVKLENGKLRAFGEIPKSGGKCDYHPMRLPHLWVEMFRRGFTLRRPGPAGKHSPWISYDFDHLRYVYFFSLSSHFSHFFFRFLSTLGKQSILDFCNENGLRVRLEVLEAIVLAVLTLETERPDIKVKDHLGSIGHFFYENVLVLLDNGIGVLRPDGNASRLNVHVLNQVAMKNFGWGGRNIEKKNSEITKEETTNTRKTTGSKAAPAACIFELFKWSEAVFRIRHGQNAAQKMMIDPFVRDEINKALNRKHAMSLIARVCKLQPVCEETPEQKAINKLKRKEASKKMKIDEIKKTQDNEDEKNRFIQEELDFWALSDS